MYLVKDIVGPAIRQGKNRQYDNASIIECSVFYFYIANP